MKRRTLLGSLLGLFGLAGTKAIPAATGPIKTDYSGFSCAIGLMLDRDGIMRWCCSRQPTVTVSTLPGAVSFEAVCDDVAALAQYNNALLMIDSRGAMGQTLVNHMLRRCPTRVWRRLKSSHLHHGWLADQRCIAEEHVMLLAQEGAREILENVQ